ncbi:MAG TPA: ATP-binding protein [Bacteroidia bacterium]|jgi:AAA+ ATPase superfamily predicted ATPase|nr:ATP-binding protein [Bacteroidia bacterium]
MDENNPFPIVGYEGPELFCDRVTETARILNALENKRNLTLISLRRMGKTGLIEHSLHRLASKRQVRTFYLDLLPTNSLPEFITLLGNQVLGKLETRKEVVWKKIQAFFTGIMPTLKYDASSGEPSIEFSLGTAQEVRYTLEQIFAFLNQQDKKIIIALDEFQQIRNYPEKYVEALLRSNIQISRNIQFIFSGSQKSILMAMFTGHANPFYQSTEILHLDPIDEQEYARFIASKFKEGQRKIKAESILYILRYTRRHTWYVQYLCNRLYGSRHRDLNEAFLSNMIQEILKENETIYYNYRNLLTANQWLLLKAIAREEQVQMIMSADFIRRHQLNSTSSMQTALEALIAKEMVYFDDRDRQYRVYDLFLSKWLKQSL